MKGANAIRERDSTIRANPIREANFFAFVMQPPPLRLRTTSMASNDAPPPDNIHWSGVTDTGRFRKNNEDAFLALTFDAREVRYLGREGEGLVADLLELGAHLGGEALAQAQADQGGRVAGHGAGLALAVAPQHGVVGRVSGPGRTAPPVTGGAAGGIGPAPPPEVEAAQRRPVGPTHAHRGRQVQREQLPAHLVERVHGPQALVDLDLSHAGAAEQVAGIHRVEEAMLAAPGIAAQGLAPALEVGAREAARHRAQGLGIADLHGRGRAGIQAPAAAEAQPDEGEREDRPPHRGTRNRGARDSDRRNRWRSAWSSTDSEVNASRDAWASPPWATMAWGIVAARPSWR